MKLKKLIAAALGCSMFMSVTCLIPAGAEGNDSSPVIMGDTEYATLAEAVKNAEGDAVITLTGDIYANDVITINKEQNITLDLGNYTMRSDFTAPSQQDMEKALIYNNGTLTIVAGVQGQYHAEKGGSGALINNTGRLVIGRENDEYTPTFGGWEVCQIYNYGGEVLVNSATFNASGSKGGGYGFINFSGSVNIKSAKFTGSTAFLNMGKVTLEKDVFINSSDVILSAGDLELNGCTIDGCALQASAGTVTINGGYYGCGIISEFPGSTAVVKINSGTFRDDITNFLTNGEKYEMIDGKFVVIEPKELTISTSSAACATGSDNSQATGFVTTVSGGEISKISWIVTSNDTSKQTAEYEISGVSGNGDFKIGLIITGLYDSAAAAKATVNGIAEN